MATLTLSNKADLGVMHDADTLRYDPEWVRQMGISREKSISFFAHCPSIGFEADGRPVGGLVLDGDEIHLSIMPEYHGIWAPVLWEQTLRWLFSLRQVVYVYIEVDNPKCIRFFEKNGWHHIGFMEKYRVPCTGYVMTAEEVACKYDFLFPLRISRAA